MNTAVRRSGLYQVVGTSVIGAAAAEPVAPSRRTTSSLERAAISDAAVFVALATVCGSEPSTTSWTCAGRPVAMSEPKRAGTTSATFAVLPRSASSISA